MPLRSLLIFFIALAFGFTGTAQTRDANASSAKPPTATNSNEKTPPKSARELEAERLLKERRANAQSLLISLAADARTFNQMVMRARTLARVASALWDADHAKTSDERDKIYLQLASLYAGKGDLRARDFIDEVADPETRKDARVYIDIRLARYAVARKDADGMIELTRTGELDHIYKSWLYSQAAKVLSKSDNDKAAALQDSAVAEARRISPSDAEAPSAFLAAANAAFLINRSAVWETMNEAVKNANSAESFTGEDGRLTFHLVTRGGPSYATQEDVPDFDLAGIFGNLADYDYDKAVQLARGLNRDAPRSAATIAIARAVLEPKKK